MKPRPQTPIKQVRNSIRQYNLIDRKDTIVIGVSGGPDSMALLHILLELRDEFGLRLVIAHLDHGLRKDSGKDADFVSAHALKLGIPCITGQADIRKRASRGSIEELARKARISFLCTAAAAVGAKKIALGHTIDDQAETVMMRILRGSGLYGLQAIIPKRHMYGYTFIRPLIEVRRPDIEKYLARKKIKPRHDSTNDSDAYARNRIRRELLPFLEKKYNRNIRMVLAQMAVTVGTDYDYLYGAASLRAEGWGLKIPLRKFLRLHLALQRLVIRQALNRLAGSLRLFSFQHMKEIEDLAVNRPLYSIVDLPKGISVVKKKAFLLFFRR